MSNQTPTAAPTIAPEAPFRTGPSGGPIGITMINGVDCDPAKAEWISASPAGENHPIGDGFHRFDEVLYRNADGYWFLVRPLGPDEAREWLNHPTHEPALAKKLFPGDDW